MAKKDIRQVFLVGIFTVTPIALTFYFVILLAGWFDGIFQPLIRPLVRPFYDQPIPGLGIILGVMFILLVGALAPSLIGKQFIRLAEGILARVPLVKMVYSSTKQVFDAFSQSSSQKFNRVVLVPFPTEDSYVIGFVTQELPENWSAQLPKLKLAVFIPTTPNPTSGYLVFVSEKDAVPLDISVEEGLKLVISGGLANTKMGKKAIKSSS